MMAAAIQLFDNALKPDSFKPLSLEVVSSFHFRKTFEGLFGPVVFDLVFQDDKLILYGSDAFDCEQVVLYPVIKNARRQTFVGDEKDWLEDVCHECLDLQVKIQDAADFVKVCGN